MPAPLSLKELEARYGKTFPIGGIPYTRFIPYPGPVDDGTPRCISCGQIDEDGFHIDAACRDALGAPQEAEAA